MKKNILIFFSAVTLTLGASAQEPQPRTAEAATSTSETPKCKVRYHGEVSLGIGLSIGSIRPFTEIRTLHGIAVGDYFSAGIGVGFEIPFLIPVYFNARGYLPVSKITRLFIGLDLGYIVNKDFYLIAPELGASFKVSRRHSINVSATYKSYHDRYMYYPSIGVVGARVAFIF